jgi:hypothetical protein
MVAKLQAFYDKLQAGEGIFAGTFLKNGEFSNTSGVLIALESALRPEHRAGIKAAQLDYEQNMRLKARSRVDELNSVCRTSENGVRAKHPGYIWAVWKDAVDGEVAYAVNPDNDVQRYIPYLGPYSFDDLKAWMIAETKYALTSCRNQESQAA